VSESTNNPSPEETRLAFAGLLMEAFRRGGETRRIIYDMETFRFILDGENRTFWIGNLFIEFERAEDAEDLKRFFSNAWDIWSMVQGPLPDLSRPSSPRILWPFCDETHPLSYRVLEVPDTCFWAVAAPFEEHPRSECYNLRDAYEMWWSDQLGRGHKKHWCNIHEWEVSGQVNVEGLRILAEMRRIWQQGRLSATTSDRRLENELKFLGSEPVVPPGLREFLDGVEDHFGSFESAAQSFRSLREQCPPQQPSVIEE